MIKNWKNIWFNREASSLRNLSLSMLIELDGYHGGAAHVEDDEWMSNANSIAGFMGIQKGDTVFEVGCGAGAFLYAISSITNSTIAGLDYSPGLISTAREVFPGSDFVVQEACLLNVSKKFDYVIAHGVFHYFEQGYARKVLEKMLKKARKGVGVFEIPNADMRQYSEAARKNAIGEEVYQQKFSDLPHTYFDKKFFDDFTCYNGQGYDVRFTESFFSNVEQSKARFGVSILKLNNAA